MCVVGVGEDGAGGPGLLHGRRLQVNQTLAVPTRGHKQSQSPVRGS